MTLQWQDSGASEKGGAQDPSVMGQGRAGVTIGRHLLGGMPVTAAWRLKDVESIPIGEPP